MTTELRAPRALTLDDLAGAGEIDWTEAAVPLAEIVPPAGTGEKFAGETPQGRFSGLVDEVKIQIQDPSADQEAVRDNLLEMFDLAAEMTAADPAGEQKLVKSLTVLLKVAQVREIVFSPETAGKTTEERRDLVGALVTEAKTLVSQPYYLSVGQRERMGEVMRQLLDHTVALGSGDKMGTSLARLLRIAGGKQVKLGGGRK